MSERFAYDLNLSQESFFFIDKDKQRHCLNNLVQLFRNTGTSNRKDNWVKFFMTPYDFRYHYLKIHI